ncbi:MAG: hypothetical protein U0133_05810 [Gemmatimonadales bacterium]
MAVITYETGRAAYYAWGFLQAVRGTFPDAEKPSGDLAARVAPVRAMGPDRSISTLDLSRTSGLVLVFDATCLVCGRTLPRWLDLIADLPPSVPIFAVAPGRPVAQQGYWRGLEDRVQPWVLERDSSVVALGATATPTTIVLRDGHPTLSFRGPLDRGRQAQILAALQEAQ